MSENSTPESARFENPSERPASDEPIPQDPGSDKTGSSGKPNPITRAISAPLSTTDVLITRIILVLVMVGAAAIIVSALWPTDTVDYVTAAPSVAAVATPDGTAANVTLAHQAEWVWTISSPTIGQRLLVAAPTILRSALVGVGAWLLLGITTRIHRGEAFAEATISRLRALAIMIMFGGLIVPFLELGTRFALSAQLQESPEVTLLFSPTVFWPVLVGMLLLLLTQVFVKGQAMGDDLEGLV
ncbi:DUF2975 domain-containing protein [Aestuariimicrobium sp. Y1814]|uniref:DUF2975 domain-containing protein n=1 Tax=Aestuariimicrobium sp. Y1814 TaxID=3418742 RepID=UPI003DA745D6